MSVTISNDRLLRFINATPEQQEIIDRILTGKVAAESAKTCLDEMVTKKQLAAQLKVTVRTVENWQRRGVLNYIKVGKIVLFHWPDVVEHLKGNFRVCRRTIRT